MHIDIKDLNEEEQDIIRSCDTPLKLVDYIRKNIVYDVQDDYSEDKLTNRSFRRIVQDKKAHCLEFAVFAAAVMKFHGYAPVFSSMDAVRDYSHGVFIFKENNKYGAIAGSRQTELWERAPIYKSMQHLMESYYPVYYNEEGEFSMIGYSELINLDSFLEHGVNWITGEKNVDAIEKHLYSVNYRLLKPDKKGRLYYTYSNENRKKYLADPGKAQFSLSGKAQRL